MPPKRHKTSQSSHSRHKKRSQPGSHAPNQGVGETMQWTLNDAQVVTCPVLASPASGVVTVRVSADMNGFSWQTAVNGSLVATFPPGISTEPQSLFGTQADQFARIAALWQEYRVDSVHVTVQPNGTGGILQPSGVFSVIDESDQLQGATASLDDTLPKLSSYKTLQLHDLYKKSQRGFNYNKWLIQTQDQCWRSTQDPQAGAQVIRQLYESPLYPGSATPSSALGRTPGIYFALGYNISNTSVLTILANLVFRVRYTFRLRKNLNGDPFLDSKFLVMTKDPEGRLMRYQVDKQEVLNVLSLPDYVENVVTQPAEAVVIDPPVDLSQSMISFISKQQKAARQK